MKYLNEKKYLVTTAENAEIIASSFPNSNAINWNKHGSGANADSSNFDGIKIEIVILCYPNLCLYQ